MPAVNTALALQAGQAAFALTFDIARDPLSVPVDSPPPLPPQPASMPASSPTASVDNCCFIFVLQKVGYRAKKTRKRALAFPGPMPCQIGSGDAYGSATGSSGYSSASA
jgi:hypothetical protein